MSVLEIELQSQLPTTSNERRRAASALRSAGGRASLSPGVVGIKFLFLRTRETLPTISLLMLSADDSMRGHRGEG